MNTAANVERCAPDVNPGMMFSPPRYSPVAKIGLIEDNRFFADCFSTLLEFDGDLDVVFIAQNYASLRKELDRTEVDLLIMDVNLGDETGLQVAESVRRECGNMPIIFISSTNAVGPQELERIGNCLFAPKGLNLGETVDAVRAMIRRPKP